MYQCHLYTSLTYRPDFKQRSQSLSATRIPNRLNSRYSDSLINMRSYRRISTLMVVLFVFLISSRLSEGADCHRDLMGDLISFKIPIQNTDEQGRPFLYSIDNKARLVRSTVRLGGVWKGTKQHTTRKQVENAWSYKS